jgi:integrase/recombinase XerD
MKTLVLKRFFHRERWRIGLFFDYDVKLNPLIRSINGIAYSGTHKCWYIDDNVDALQEVERIINGYADIDDSALNTGTKKIKQNNLVLVSGNPEPVKLKHKVNDQKDEPPDDNLIPVSRILNAAEGRKSFDPVELKINETDGQLSVKFTGHYDPAWVEEIASYSRSGYDKTSKQFLLPWSPVTVDSISDFFTYQGVEVRILKEKISEALSALRKETGDEIRSRELGDKAQRAIELMEKHLGEMRYSRRTSESYLPLLTLFFKYYNDKDPLKITNSDVSYFVNDFIIRNGYSSSYQNQMISSIKVFFKISGRKKLDVRLFERPRRSRALPKVFSKEEVKRILSATNNDKHRLLLWLIYSCGLRRMEITNIRLADLDRERSILHIREGKGKVDRIVPVSEMVWEKIEQYTGGYMPKEYLFEGQGGGRYSSESVYRVFKGALRKAGINREVGVHSLRHSYATHLHESGLDIRYIQELLGHKSTRTTEIYTHVSRRNLSSIRSPIEDLGIK